MLAAAFVDELAAGIVPASAPELGDAFGVPGVWLAGLLLTVPLALSLAVEPLLFVAADRARDRRWFVRAGYLSVGMASLAAAVLPAAWMMVVAFAVCAPAWGVGTGVAEASLVERDPARAERQMTRWTIAGAIGDLAGPVLLAGAAAVGLGWRAAFVVVGALALAAALAVPSLPNVRGNQSPAPDDDAGAVRSLIRTALRNRRLLAWSVGVLLCNLLDEVLLVLAAVHLDAVGFAATERGVLLGALLVGSAVGLFLAERLLATVAPLRLLSAVSAMCATSFALWVFWPSLPLAFVVGMTISPQYPIAKAQAYRAAPGAPGLVNAIDALLDPVGVAFPILLALAASTLGTATALLLLATQPIVLCWLAFRAPARGRN